MSQLIVSLSPHVRSKDTSARIMTDVIIALLPSCAVGIWFFGISAAMVLAVGTLSAVLAEYVWCKAAKKPLSIKDMSAAVTGLLLAMNLPSTAPWWMVAIGGAFAIVVVKQFFGGLGQNFLNPALAARAFLLASWPSRMTAYFDPAFDAVTSATPLMTVYGKMQGSLPPVSTLLLGNMPGTIGEVSKAALILGAAYLFLRGTISPRIPVIYIGTVFVLSSLLTGGGPSLATGAYAVATGGLFLGAIFMATDYVTSPLTFWGQVIFAFGCGFITFVIRKYGAYPEGASFSILLMNILTPLIDRFIKPRKYGEVRKKS